jgi:hypothetical protein
MLVKSRPRLIRRHRGPFAYPGTSPRLDINHLSLQSNGVIRSACVAMNGTMVDLQSGIKGTMNGSASIQILPRVGHALTGTAIGDYCKFTTLPKALTTSENTITLASIFVFNNTANQRILAVSTSATLNTGHGMGSRNSIPYIAVPGNNEANITAIPNFIAGRTYFMAWSPGSSGQIVVTDMTTGMIYTATSAVATGLFPTDGSFTVGASPSTNLGQGIGSVAAGALISNSLSQAKLVEWAQDPWSLWYADR